MDYEEQIKALQARCNRLEKLIERVYLWTAVKPEAIWNMDDYKELIGISMNPQK